MEKIKIAAIQMSTVADKMENVRTVKTYLEKIKDEKPDFVILPEMFCCPYQTENFPIYAEEEGGPIWQQLSAYAKQYGIYLIGGSMPEKDAEGNVYNTSYIFDREGKQIGKHRKVHLFDIDVKGGQTFKESDTLTAGDSDTVFDTEFGKIGVMLCFDIRFPELSRMMVNDGVKVIFVPAAFNMTTGPAHWELSFRTRALDNQIYMVGCAPARDVSAGYISWGHSIVTDPWGRVTGMLDENEGILLAELDMDYEEQVREELPLLKSRRKDIYQLSQNLFNSGNSTESSLIFRDNCLYFLKFKVIYIADQSFIFSGNDTGRIDDRTGLIEVFFDLPDNSVRVFGDDRDLLDGFEMICKMIDNCCGNNVYQKTQHGGIPADEYEDCKVYNEIKSDQYVGNTVVFSGFVVNLMNNNIGEDFRAVNTASVP